MSVGRLRSPGTRLALVAGLLAVGLAALAVVFAVGSYRGSRDRAIGSLRDLAGQAASDTAAYATQQRRSLQQVARGLAPTDGDPAKVRSLLRQLALPHRELPSGLIWATPDGRVQALSRPGPAAAGAGTAFLRTVAQARHFAVSPAVDVPALGGSATLFAIPTFSGGHLTGVLAVGATTQLLSSSAAAYRLPKGETLWIADRNGLLIAGPKLAQPRPAAGEGAVAKGLEAGTRAVAHTGLRGLDPRQGRGRAVAATAQEPATGWLLIVQALESDLFGAARHALWRDLAVIAALLVLGLAGVGLFARGFDRLARAQEEARRRAERTLVREQSLGRLAASLSAAVGAGDVRHTLLDWALDALGGTRALLALRDGGQAHLHVLDRSARDAVRSQPLDLDALASLVERLPLWASDGLPPELLALDPGCAGARAGLAKRLAVAGGAIGAFAVVADGSRTFDEEERAHWRAFAAQGAQALERARLTERERAIATEFQLRLLPRSIAADPHAAISAIYRPAESIIAVGGDWYDAIPLPDGRIVLAVGDVIGHGVQAAVVMGQLRTAVTALAPICDGPAELLEQLDTFTADVEGGAFSTMQCAYLDPQSGIVRSASAGHPPMIVIDGAGVPAYAWGGRSAPLCVNHAGTRTEEVRLLEPGATLVLFTDGLYERRERTVERGMERLLEACAAAAAPRGSHDLAQAILTEMLASSSSAAADDIAILTVTLAARPIPAFVAAVDVSPRSLGALRSDLRAWLDEVLPEAPLAGDVVLAVHEAAANALEHAYADEQAAAPDRMTAIVELRRLPGSLEAVVRDTGRWRDQEILPASLNRTGRGRGLGIIGMLASDASVDRSRGTTIRMRFDLAGAPIGGPGEAGPAAARATASAGARVASGFPLNAE